MITLNMFHRTENEGTFPKSFYCKDIRLKKINNLISLIHIETKTLNKPIANWIKGNHDLVGFTSGMQG